MSVEDEIEDDLEAKWGNFLCQPNGPVRDTRVNTNIKQLMAMGIVELRGYKTVKGKKVPFIAGIIEGKEGLDIYMQGNADSSIWSRHYHDLSEDKIPLLPKLYRGIVEAYKKKKAEEKAEEKK